jgi:hypothetical protein
MYVQCTYTGRQNRGMAQLTIYLTDDLKQRVEEATAAGIIDKVSPLCQPVLGYAVLHGQAATEAVLRELLNGTSGGAQVNQARLAGEPTLIMRYRRPAAVLVPVGWYEEAAAALHGSDQPNDGLEG